jgi:hypothetical protein
MAALASLNPILNMPQTVLPQRETDPRISDTSDTAEYLRRLNDYIFESIGSLRIGQIKALDSDFAPLDQQLDRLTGLAEGWDGYDAPVPSGRAIAEAREILRQMQQELVTPQWIGASADGGVAFSFAASNDRRAQIEILNNGEKFAHLYDLKGNSHTEEWTENLHGQIFRNLLEPILHYIKL